MNYLVKITGNDEKALSIINLLKTFATDYDFLQITEQDDNMDLMSSDDKIEFENRYNYTLQNMEEGKTWEEIEQKLLTK